MTVLMSRVDDIDVQIERIKRLIESGSRLDPELGAGLGCSESLTSVQRKVDQAVASCDALNSHLKDLRRKR